MVTCVERRINRLSYENYYLGEIKIRAIKVAKVSSLADVLHKLGDVG